MYMEKPIVWTTRVVILGLWYSILQSNNIFDGVLAYSHSTMP